MSNKTYFCETWLCNNGFMEWTVRFVSKENAQGKLEVKMWY